MPKGAKSVQAEISQHAPESRRSVARSRAGRAAGASARHWPWLAALVLLAAVLPYWKSVGYEFVWDDKVMIGPALDVHGPGDLPRLWQIPFDRLLRDPLLNGTYFRPAVLFSLALDRGLYGSEPSGYHLTNLLWYAAACLFLWLLAWELSGKALAAAAGAVLFALHPTHPESVCFIAGRTDLLCGAFLFASLWTAARWGPRKQRNALKLAPASGLYLLALFSKEIAFLAAPLLPLVLWMRDRRLGLRAVAIASIPVAAAAAVYWVSRTAVLGPHVLPPASPVEGWAAQVLTSIAVLARYVPLLLVPISLSARHEVAAIHAPDLLFGAGLLVLIAILAALVFTLRRRSTWAVPIALFACTLLPLCYVRLIAGALVAERFLFIPSGTLALAAALLPRGRGLFVAAVAAPLLLVLLLPRVSIWKNDRALYDSMLRDSPSSAYVHAVLGSYYYDRRDLPRAIEHHRRAFQLKPDFVESLLNLSAAEDENGQQDSAFAHARLLLRLRPDYAPGWYALGNLFVRVDRPDSAIAAYREAIRLRPEFAQAENNLGVVLERVGRTEEAVAHYRRALEVIPGYPDAANNLSRLTRGGSP